MIFDVPVTFRLYLNPHNPVLSTGACVHDTTNYIIVRVTIVVSTRNTEILPDFSNNPVKLRFSVITSSEVVLKF